MGVRTDVRRAVCYPEPRVRPAVRTARNLLDFNLPTGPTVWDAISDLPEVEQFADLVKQDAKRVRLGRPSEYAARLQSTRVDPDDFSYPRTSTGVLTGMKRASHTDLSRKRFAETPNGETEPISRFKKLDPNGVCNTLRAGTARNHGAFTSPRPIHPLTARCITVREAARLHSFPDWFAFHATIWHGFRQIGNAVPPLLARAVAAEVVKTLGMTVKKPEQSVGQAATWLRITSMSRAAEHFGADASVIPRCVRRLIEPVHA